jgi:hypothetical protein
MNHLRWLCQSFPAYRTVFIGVWYALFLPMAAAWGVCFPGAAIFLYFFDAHPLSTKLSQFGPLGITKGIFLAFSLAITVAGLVAIYFNVREIRKLRLGNSN